MGLSVVLVDYEFKWALDFEELSFAQTQFVNEALRLPLNNLLRAGRTSTAVRP